MNQRRLLLFCVLAGFLAIGVTPAWTGDQKSKPTDPDKKRKPRFTISKETTYVTGPRHKDGYIDYASALNERLGKGVTPANNANVLLWKAFGPKPEGGKGMPADFYKWMGIEPLPEKGDYLLHSFWYMKKHLEIDPQRDLQALQADFDAASARPWTTKQSPLVAGWLTVNEKPFALAVEATKRTHYFSPLAGYPTEKGPPALLASLLPGVQRCREFANALSIRAMLHLGESRYDDAWQDLLACHRLGRHVAHGSTLIEGLVGIAIDAIASGADLTFLDRAKLDAKQIKQCLRDLQELPPMPVPADKVDLGERFMFLDTVMMVDRHGIGYLEGLLGKGPIPLAKRIPDDIDWDPALRNANRWYDRLAAAMRLKDRGSREKQLDQIEQELKAVKKALVDSGEVAKFAAASPEAKGKVLGDVLISLLVPAVRKVQQAADRTEQIQRNLHVAFALAAYQRDHKRYPMKLEALAPTYLARIPNDVFSGRPLIYRPSEKGYLLYSVGANGQDEGGRWYDDMPPGDDPRVLMPRP
jgi:hypothetical protein